MLSELNTDAAPLFWLLKRHQVEGVARVALKQGDCLAVALQGKVPYTDELVGSLRTQYAAYDCAKGSSVDSEVAAETVKAILAVIKVAKRSLTQAERDVILKLFRIIFWIYRRAITNIGLGRAVLLDMSLRPQCSINLVEVALETTVALALAETGGSCGHSGCCGGVDRLLRLWSGRLVWFIEAQQDMPDQVAEIVPALRAVRHFAWQLFGAGNDDVALQFVYVNLHRFSAHTAGGGGGGGDGGGGGGGKGSNGQGGGSGGEGGQRPVAVIKPRLSQRDLNELLLGERKYPHVGRLLNLARGSRLPAARSHAYAAMAAVGAAARRHVGPKVAAILAHIRAHQEKDPVLVAELCALLWELAYIVPELENDLLGREGDARLLDALGSQFVAERVAATKSAARQLFLWIRDGRARRGVVVCCYGNGRDGGGGSHSADSNGCGGAASGYGEGNFDDVRNCGGGGLGGIDRHSNDGGGRASGASGDEGGSTNGDEYAGGVEVELVVRLVSGHILAQRAQTEMPQAPALDAAMERLRLLRDGAQGLLFRAALQAVCRGLARGALAGLQSAFAVRADDGFSGIYSSNDPAGGGGPDGVNSGAWGSAGGGSGASGGSGADGGAAAAFVPLSHDGMHYAAVIQFLADLLAEGAARDGLAAEVARIMAEVPPGRRWDRAGIDVCAAARWLVFGFRGRPPTPAEDVGFAGK